MSLIMLDPSQDELPPYCTPTTAFLADISRASGVCIPIPLAAISTLLGTLSIISWLFAQMPQIYKNYQIKSTAGLSIYFLSEWLAGDLTNLLGAILTQQATWQIIVASYYTFVDICLVWQFFWYSYISPKWRGSSLHSRPSSQGSDNGSDVIDALSPINEEFRYSNNEMLQTSSKLSSKRGSENESLFSPVDYKRSSIDISTSPDRKDRNLGISYTASPRTVLTGTLTALTTPARAAPIGLKIATHLIHPHTVASSSNLVQIGTILSWCSTLLYLFSRLPQLYKNYRRKSTAGLSPLLFFAAFSGNLFYSTSLLTNPNAWSSAPAYGLHGWVDASGNDRIDWLIRATPFFLGAAGVLFMDAMMGVQFLLYAEREEELVKVRDGDGRGSHWEIVNGWMRGWVPNMSSRRGKVVDLAESQRLLRQERDLDRLVRGGAVFGYGTGTGTGTGTGDNR